MSLQGDVTALKNIPFDYRDVHPQHFTPEGISRLRERTETYTKTTVPDMDTQSSKG